MLEVSNLDTFFPFSTYRPGQKECMIKIIEAFERGYNLFFIDGPVGIGKSPILFGVCRYFAHQGLKAFYTTPQNILLDQLHRDFPGIPQIKGRKHYCCLYESEFTCDEGYCQRDWNYRAGDCIHDPWVRIELPTGESVKVLKSEEECPRSMWCEYHAVLYTAEQSPHMGTNTAYLLEAKGLGNRDICIFDEAHNIPEQAIDGLGPTVREKDFGDTMFGVSAFSRHVDYYLTEGLKIIETKLDSLEMEISGMPRPERDTMTKDDFVKATQDIKRLMKEKRRLQRLNETIVRMLVDFKRNEEPWIVTQEVLPRQGKVLRYRPLTAARFLEGNIWSRGKMVILASATITPRFFLKEGGLEARRFDSKDCVFMAPNPFPKDRSPVYYKPVGKMARDYQEDTWPLMIKEINTIVRARQDRRGIIHTFSYERAKIIQDRIAPDLRRLLVIQARDAREQSLNEWLRDPRQASVFISTNMTEGLDLKDNLCRYQIYVKVGFPNLSDKRVAIRLRRGDQAWYRNEAIIDLEQASGRATRSDTDWSEMFILDESFGGLLAQGRVFFKRWFLDRIQTIPVGTEIKPLNVGKI